MQEMDEDYICHVVIPSKNLERSKVFYEKAFGWKVEQQTGTKSLDALSPSGKGISAELNPEERVVVPSIHTSNIEAKLVQIEEIGGKKLENKTPIGKNAQQGYFALFEDPLWKQNVSLL
jgi:predicted enzyme related to lactoylglutathione lyase